MENLALQQRKYTYEDLQNFEDEKRYELINGELYLMSSPTTLHQEIIGEIHAQLHNYLKRKKCKVFVSPLDVCLSGVRNPKKEYNVVQPDILVVCDENKITKNMGIQGAPDLIIEVLSPTSKKHDTFVKYNLYQYYGVKEYWIIDGEVGVIYQYIINEKNIYTLPKTYEITENIKVNILKDCTISLKNIIEQN
ncbi:MAG: Uma2 family endonuclease [Clostridia bacterium]|nr:Uma2 family endonuclease [Clostridia bacterium]